MINQALGFRLLEGMGWEGRLVSAVEIDMLVGNGVRRLKAGCKEVEGVIGIQVC